MGHSTSTLSFPLHQYCGWTVAVPQPTVYLKRMCPLPFWADLFCIKSIEIDDLGDSIDGAGYGGQINRWDQLVCAGVKGQHRNKIPFLWGKKQKNKLNILCKCGLWPPLRVRPWSMVSWSIVSSYLYCIVCCMHFDSGQFLRERTNWWRNCVKMAVWLRWDRQDTRIKLMQLTELRIL